MEAQRLGSECSIGHSSRRDSQGRLKLGPSMDVVDWACAGPGEEVNIVSSQSPSGKGAKASCETRDTAETDHASSVVPPELPSMKPSEPPAQRVRATMGDSIYADAIRAIAGALRPFKTCDPDDVAHAGLDAALKIAIATRACPSTAAADQSGASSSSMHALHHPHPGSIGPKAVIAAGHGGIAFIYSTLQVALEASKR